MSTLCVAGERGERASQNDKTFASVLGDYENASALGSLCGSYSPGIGWGRVNVRLRVAAAQEFLVKRYR